MAHILASKESLEKGVGELKRQGVRTIIDLQGGDADAQLPKLSNGGHITKAEQRQLNREENGVSREINRDERQNTQSGSAPVSAPTAGL